MNTFDELLKIMKQLRDPKKGCPWDLEQTLESLVPHTLEEAYEVAEAVEQGGRQNVVSELGDLLFQVIFYAQIASETHDFDIEDVCRTLKEKLIRRHPHIFGAAEVKTAQEQSQLWESIKSEERGDKGSVLSDIPVHFSALSRAQKIQKRAAQVGFDWTHVSQVFDKIEEEVEELGAQLEHNKKHAAQELGDLLFACVNMARWLEVDAEQQLRAASDKFTRRFKHVESQVVRSNRGWPDHSLQELELYWQTAKNDEMLDQET